MSHVCGRGTRDGREGCEGPVQTIKNGIFWVQRIIVKGEGSLLQSISHSIFVLSLASGYTMYVCIVYIHPIEI